MFTGIVIGVGRLVGWAARLDTGKRFCIETSWDDLKQGESISVNGVCLTVTEIDGLRFYADVSPETLEVTTLGTMKSDSQLNLERALMVGDRMGGHFVTGHVDGVCLLQAKTVEGDFLEYTFGGFSEKQRPWLLGKGSVAINGVSLTLNEVNDLTFSVMLIPETLEKTNLSGLEDGAAVNVEFDMLAKLVVQQVQTNMKGVTA